MIMDTHLINQLMLEFRTIGYDFTNRFDTVENRYEYRLYYGKNVIGEAWTKLPEQQLAILSDLLAVAEVHKRLNRGQSHEYIAKTMMIPVPNVQKAVNHIRATVARYNNLKRSK